MTRYAFTPRARADLSEIWNYTARRWDPGQADRYIRQIEAVCADLAAGRKQGRSAASVRPGYFRCAAGSHVLFYKTGDAGTLEIVRILHQRMDVERHL